MVGDAGLSEGLVPDAGAADRAARARPIVACLLVALGVLPVPVTEEDRLLRREPLHADRAHVAVGLRAPLHCGFAVRGCSPRPPLRASKNKTNQQHACNLDL